MRAHDGTSCANVTTGSYPTAAGVLLLGGAYCLDVVATGAGSVTLQRLGPDGATWITAATALTATGTSGSLALPTGTYRITVAGLTAVYASLTPTPGE